VVSVADGCAAAANLSATVRSRREDRDDRSLGCGEGEERCSSRRIAAAHGGAAGDFGAVEEERFGESKVTGEAACENNSPLPRAFFVWPRRVCLSSGPAASMQARKPNPSAPILAQFGVRLPVAVPTDRRDFPRRFLRAREGC
jgi:hypothetical protein